jgi:hypothetical protein
MDFFFPFLTKKGQPVNHQHGAVHVGRPATEKRRCSLQMLGVVCRCGFPCTCRRWIANSYQRGT